jgi:YggT family protein
VSALDSVLYWIGVLLYVYWFVLIARVAMSWVLALSQYRPSGVAAIAFEFVYSITDPPERALRRFIPDLTMGSFVLPTAFLVLIIGVRILVNVLMAG